MVISPADEEPDLDEIIVSSGHSPLGTIFIFIGVLIILFGLISRYLGGS